MKPEMLFLIYVQITSQELSQPIEHQESIVILVEIVGAVL